MAVFLPLSADGPARPFPIATFALVASNLIVFAVQLALPGEGGARLLYAGGAIPYEIAQLTDIVDGSLHPVALVPPPLTVMSAMFLHGGVEHLVGNLWFLWIFGRRVEATIGSPRFLAFYLLVGSLAAAAQIAMTPASRIPMVGASGAIAGVLGAYLSIHPRGRVQVLLFLLVAIQTAVVPAFAALGVWFAWQVLAGTGDGSVATWAHLGGFLVGAASCTLLRCRATADRRTLPRGVSAPWTPSPAAGTSSSPR